MSKRKRSNLIADARSKIVRSPHYRKLVKKTPHETTELPSPALKRYFRRAEILEDVLIQSYRDV